MRSGGGLVELVLSKGSVCVTFEEKSKSFFLGVANLLDQTFDLDKPDCVLLNS